MFTFWSTLPVLIFKWSLTCDPILLSSFWAILTLINAFCNMGTVLSVSPIGNKCTVFENGGTEANGKIEKSLKKPSVIVSTFTFKRFLGASCKQQSMKVIPDPNPASSGNQEEHLNQENSRRSHPDTNTERQTKNGPLAVPVHLNDEQETVTPVVKLVSMEKQPSSLSLNTSRHVIVQASTGELLRCLGEFVCKRCIKLTELTPNEVILWFRNLDRLLLLQGWQDYGFITPANLVFVYLLVRETVSGDMNNPQELHRTFLTCLYLAYSYMGNEISYPLKPFMIDPDEDIFFDRSLGIIDKLSGKMLLINMDPHFFTEVFQDLKNEGEVKRDGSELDR